MSAAPGTTLELITVGRISVDLYANEAGAGFIDPQTFAVAREIDVRDHGQPVTKLNELEYVDGEIWSNVWYDDRIARISPASGEVLGWVDLAALYPKSARGSEAVLNGIAYDAAAKRLFVTGKNWPQLYEIQIVQR